ncbi:MAG: Carboxylesterase, type B [uncultured Frankineae bacterium]|uniref:Carboxylesterase, type B n=1 Tax=uncultured Frankineae bacterium TaxID=437475 RepID=A0A6J4MHE1_9ACTN|nr:MAG: Carboxylesterase, type B [uncultured Frankineae bacterium]
MGGYGLGRRHECSRSNCRVRKRRRCRVTVTATVTAADAVADPTVIGTAGASSARARSSLSLPGEPASASVARQVVRDALDLAGRSHWSDAAELASTEIVSNVVLHAHTDLQLTVEVFDHVVRVEVRDFSPVLPVQRDYSAHATTGRGMALVAAVSSEHGVSDVGPDGKTVWFTVGGDAVEQSESELLAAWEDADWDLGELLDQPPGDVGEDVVTVHLLGLPPMLWLAAREHHDALVRELSLHLAQHEQDGPSVDVPATDLARSTVSAAVVEAVERSQRSGAARRAEPTGPATPLPDAPEAVDLELAVPSGAGAAFRAMQATLDAAEELAEAGLLLVRPGQPEIVAVRDWVCEQVVAQLAGAAPAPWAGADQEQFTVVTKVRAHPRSEWDVALVRDSSCGVVAADEANRIVAVSEPLCDVLGWAVDDLVGRRVVTVIPKRYREAHVAAFTRHLTTGEAHLLDVPLVVPVLRADGTELMCTLLVQQAPTDGRAVYLAWIEPLGDAPP